MDAKVIKKLKPDEEGGAGNSNKTENGTCEEGNGEKKQCPIDNEHVVKKNPLYKNFKLNVTTQAHSNDNEGPNSNFDGVTPRSKVNGTAVTIADILKKDEKVLIGKATYTKKCDDTGNCFVAKCKHYGPDNNKQRFCTIFKDNLKDAAKEEEHK